MRENDIRNLHKCIIRLYHNGIINHRESFIFIKRLLAKESEVLDGKNEKNAECGK